MGKLLCRFMGKISCRSTANIPDNIAHTGKGIFYGCDKLNLQ